MGGTSLRYSDWRDSLAHALVRNTSERATQSWLIDVKKRFSMLMILARLLSRRGAEHDVELGGQFA
jgi:hypothetical protein